MILITGSKGLIGSALMERLTTDDRAPVGIDREVDITDRSALAAAFKQHSPTVVVHCAAMTAVDLCETECAQAWATNAQATADIATLCAQTNARLIYISTDYVFDGRTGAYAEDSGLSPLGVYAQTKAAGELAVRSLCADHVIARISVPFGPQKHAKKDFVRWLRDELSAKRPVRIVDDQISNPTYAPDFARLLEQLLDFDFRGTLHLCGATSLSRESFARRIAKTFDLDTSLITPIHSAALKQASPRPMNASLRVDTAQHMGLHALDIDHALKQLRERS